MKKTFRIYHPDYFGSDTDDLPTVEAFDAEDAAEQFGNEYDSNGDYTIANGSAQVFGVKEVNSKSEWEFFRVRAEPTVDYYSDKETEGLEEYKKDLGVTNA